MARALTSPAKELYLAFWARMISVIEYLGRFVSEIWISHRYCLETWQFVYVFKVSSKYDTAFHDVPLHNARVDVHESVTAQPSEQPASFLLDSELLLLDDAVNDVGSGMALKCLIHGLPENVFYNVPKNDV